MSRTLNLLLLGLGAALLALVVRRAGLDELRAALAAASAARFALFLTLSVAVFVVYGLRWRTVTRAMTPQGAPQPSLGRLVAYRACEHAASTLIPAAHLSGEPLRALLLRRSGVAWRTAAASVAMDRILEASASSAAGPLYVVIFFAASGGQRSVAPWALAGMLVAAAGLGLFYLQLLRGGRLFARLAHRGFLSLARESLEEIDRKLAVFVRSRAFWAALGLSFIAELLIIAELTALFSAFSLPLTLPQILGVMVGMGVAQLVPVPAALGSLEAAQVGVLALAGRPADLGLAVGLVVRVRETLWIAVGLATLWIEGLRFETLSPPADNDAAAERPLIRAG